MRQLRFAPHHALHVTNYSMRYAIRDRITSLYATCDTRWYCRYAVLLILYLERAGAEGPRTGSDFLSDVHFLDLVKFWPFRARRSRQLGVAVDVDRTSTACTALAHVTFSSPAHTMDHRAIEIVRWCLRRVDGT